MAQLLIPGFTKDVSDGYHTFGELYNHRSILYIAFLQTLKSSAWMSRRHCDDSQWDGWFIAGTTLPTGDISYHLDVKFWDILKNSEITVLDNAPKWDGYSSDDVFNRICEYVRLPKDTSC
jgi:hypothetical protein